MQDIWGHIVQFIKQDKNKCYLMMTCKWISKCNFYFDDQIDIDKIIGSLWFDHFRSVIIKDIVSLPPSIIHLTFSPDFNQPINGFIPSSVIELVFGSNFNQPINGCIPSAVECVFFGHNFNQSIENCF